jgi:hypothetical protein
MTLGWPLAVVALKVVAIYMLLMIAPIGLEGPSSPR